MAQIFFVQVQSCSCWRRSKATPELSRDIAQSFNRFYDTEFFPIPEPVITGNATRVMSLRDGTKK